MASIVRDPPRGGIPRTRYLFLKCSLKRTSIGINLCSQSRNITGTKTSSGATETYWRGVDSRLHRKPDRYDDERQDDGAPHHRCYLFRNSASRGVISGAVEFPIHLGPFKTKPPMRQEMPVAALPKHRPNLIPKRRTLLGAVMLRGRWLCCSGRIGCRKAVDQTGLQFRVGVPV